jgi:hypothetical protein
VEAILGGVGASRSAVLVRGGGFTRWCGLRMSKAQKVFGRGDALAGLAAWGMPPDASRLHVYPQPHPLIWTPENEGYPRHEIA